MTNVYKANQLLSAAALALAANGTPVQTRRPSITLDIPSTFDPADNERDRHNAAVGRRKALRKLARMDRHSKPTRY